MPALVQLLRLDLLGRPVPRLVAKDMDDPQSSLDGFGGQRRTTGRKLTDVRRARACREREESCRCPSCSTRPAARRAASLPAASCGNPTSRITLNKNVLKRHAAVLGGSGSGKTTLALCIIEQLLLRGISGGADRPQGRSVLLRQSGRVARASRASSASAAASARSSPTPSTSPSIRRAAPRAGRSRSRCCPTASTSCPTRSSSCWPTCRPRRSATCCISRTRPRTRSSRARCRWRCASSAAASARR